MYDVYVDGTMIAKGLDRENAFAFAEEYLEDHRSESVTLCIKRIDTKSVIECQ